MAPEEAELDKETMTPEEWEARRENEAQAYHDEIYEQSRLQQEEAKAVYQKARDLEVKTQRIPNNP